MAEEVAEEEAAAEVIAVRAARVVRVPSRVAVHRVRVAHHIIITTAEASVTAWRGGLPSVWAVKWGEI